MSSLITIIGPIASGKTTLSRLLSQELKLPLIDADLYDSNPFLPDYVQDIPRWAFTTELYFTLARLKKLSPLPKMLQKSSVIVDSGLIMSHHVYTRNHLVQGNMTEAEWDFFTRIITNYQKDLPQPNIIINLLAKPTTQLARIQARGRDFEKAYTLEYLTQITDRLTEYVSQLHQKKTHLITIDSDQVNILDPSAQQQLIQTLTSQYR